MSSEALNTIAYHRHFIMWHLAGYLAYVVVLTTALQGDGNTLLCDDHTNIYRETKATVYSRKPANIQNLRFPLYRLMTTTTLQWRALVHHNQFVQKMVKSFR